MPRFRQEAGRGRSTRPSLSDSGKIRIVVGKPPTLSRSQRNVPALYLLDGQYYFSRIHGVLAALESDGQLPEMLPIGIESQRSPVWRSQALSFFETVSRSVSFVAAARRASRDAAFSLVQLLSSSIR